MTTPAEELKPGHEVMTAAIRYGASSVNRAIDGNSAYFFISQQVRLRDALITAQAAEIERLRGRIQIAEGTLVAWLREQGGGVDPVRHALATLRAIP